MTIRLRRSKSEIQARARPNVNSWINDLIDQALGARQADWEAHFERRKKRQAVHFCSDEVRRANR